MVLFIFDFVFIGNICFSCDCYIILDCLLWMVAWVIVNGVIIAAMLFGVSVVGLLVERLGKLFAGW